MKRKKLFHPVVFDEEEWAIGYYNRNKKNITRIGKRFSKSLKEKGFKSGKILDVGCGFASVPVEIAKKFPDTKIIGIDLATPLLDIGNDIILENKLDDRISLMKGNAMDIKFNDNTFDLVINTFLLHIVDDPNKMLNEIERVCKPEGIIMITDLRRGFLANFIKKLRTSHTIKESYKIIENSKLRSGNMSKGIFWWDYFCI